MPFLTRGERRINPDTFARVRTESEKLVNSRWRDTDKPAGKGPSAMIRTLAILGITCAAFSKIMDFMSSEEPTVLNVSLLVVMVVLISTMIAAFYMMWFSPHRLGDIPTSVRADKMIEHGCCADCGSSISNIVAESDGCIVCAHCGAAWKVPASEVAEPVA